MNKLEGVVWHNLVKDDLFFFVSGALEPLLDETRSVLVATKFDDITEYILIQRQRVRIHDDLKERITSSALPVIPTAEIC